MLSGTGDRIRQGRERTASRAGVQRHRSRGRRYDSRTLLVRDAPGDEHGRVKFYVGDVGNPPEELWRLSYDIIFGIESFCHIDDAEHRERVLLLCRTTLKPKGKLVIVDGHRCDPIEFDRMNVLTRTAMRLAEAGFQINAMPSRGIWKQAACCARGGMALEYEADLTEEAGKFWTGWWKLAHVLLQWIPAIMLCRFRELVPSSFDNFVAVCMAGPAFHFRAAKYGVLVFRRRTNRRVKKEKR